MEELKIDYKETWNILNTRKEAILDELYFIENLMGLLEIRSQSKLSKKLFFSTQPQSNEIQTTNSQKTHLHKTQTERRHQGRIGHCA